MADIQIVPPDSTWGSVSNKNFHYKKILPYLFNYLSTRVVSSISFSSTVYGFYFGVITVDDTANRYIFAVDSRYVDSTRYESRFELLAIVSSRIRSSLTRLVFSPSFCGMIRRSSIQRST